MNRIDSESLSALIDNETDELELRRLLKAVEQDAELLNVWERMNLVQAVLHDDNVKNYKGLKLTGGDFAAKVAEVIAQEPGPSQNVIKNINWTQSLAKFGIAASVALAFFLGMQTTTNHSGLSGQTVPALAGQVAPLVPQEQNQADNDTGVLLAETTVSEVDPLARQRLEDYIKSVSITPEEPVQLEPLQNSPLYRLVNEIQNSQ